MSKPILVISTSVDAATDAVVNYFDRHDVAYVRINTEDMPFCGCVSVAYQDKMAPQIYINIHNQMDEPASSFHSIWYRRLRAPAPPESMDPGVYDFSIRETRTTLIGTVFSNASKIMSPPESVWRAENKLFQLRVATDIGLSIPDTLVSNDPTMIRNFYSSTSQGLVIKPVRTGYLVNQGESRSIYTNRFLDKHLDCLQEAQYSPSIYQAFVDKTYDIRATYVGGHIFTAAIHSQTDNRALVDWRRTSNPDLPHSVHQLPSTLENNVRVLMKTLGLEYGAIDFVLDSGGRYYFLEVNPNGQWLWLDRLLELGITEAVSTWLMQ